MNQLLIDFKESNYPSFDSFLGRRNQELLSILKSGESKLIFLWGPEGIGKSHLLKAWVKQRLSEKRKAVLISVTHKNILQDVFKHDYEFIAIDDIHQFGEESQIQLFNLFNEVLDADCNLLISSNLPPQRLVHIRSDLRTRLGLCLIYQVYPLSEEEKLVFLKEFARVRQINISDEVLNYLIYHSPRNLNFLLNSLMAMDNYAIQNHRRITIPLLKQFFLEHQNE